MTDEFVGPLASWANLKTTFGATGNGVTDDTAALQAALTSICTAGNSPVLFVPAGTYLITQTVVCTAALGVQMLGEDPATTKFKWGGSSAGTLLRINGVTLSAFNRITYDGSTTAGILIDQSVSDTSGGRYFDTGNQYIDNVFQDASIGIQGGLIQGASETTVLRCKFYRCTSFGAIIKNFNALDWWFWYCYFEDCQVGISNNPGAGNYHSYCCHYKTTKSVDLDLENTGTFNFRDNFSENSNQFLYEQFYYTNAAITRLQSNQVVIGPRLDGQSALLGLAVDQGNEGPLLMTDNVIVSPANPTSPSVVHMGATDPPDVFMFGDTFTVASTIITYSQLGQDNSTSGARIEQTGVTVVNASSLTLTPPALPVAAPNNHRHIVEVPAGSTAAAVQAAVNQADAGFRGQKPVVHLAYGNYSFEATVTIPIGSDVQVIGDGLLTKIGRADPNIWTGWNNSLVQTDPVFYLPGPAKCKLKDFYVNPGTSVGVQVQTADQVGSRIYMRKVGASSATVANVYVKLDNTNVEQHDIGNSAAVAPAIGLRVIGAGNPALGKTRILSGSGGNNNVSVKISDGATAVVRDYWCEQNTGAFVQVIGNGNLSLEGSRCSVNSGPAVQLINSTGNVLVLGCSIDNAIGVTGTAPAQTWVVGNSFESPSMPVTAAGMGFNLNRWNDHSYGSRPLTDAAALSPTVQTQLLALSRSTHPDPMNDLPINVTDVCLDGIAVEHGTVGVYLLGVS